MSADPAPDWSRLDLGDAQLAGPDLDRLAGRLRAAQADAGPDADVAAFVRHESDGRLHCAVVVYFSPAASTIARELGAVSCARPAPGDLGLVVGPPDAMGRLFAAD